MDFQKDYWFLLDGDTHYQTKGFDNIMKMAKTLYPFNKNLTIKSSAEYVKVHMRSGTKLRNKVVKDLFHPIRAYRVVGSVPKVLSLQLPDVLEKTTFTPEQINRFKLAILPEIAEAHALSICRKKFGIEFLLGSYNSQGFDIISIDGKIIVEVKQTSSVLGKSKRLQIGSYRSKEGSFTHILILDYHSSKGCILEHDDFFYNTTHHANNTSWKWDSEYNMKGSNRCARNTQWFLNNLVEL